MKGHNSLETVRTGIPKKPSGFSPTEAYEPIQERESGRRGEGSGIATIRVNAAKARENE
jgi:hypothetical protein